MRLTLHDVVVFVIIAAALIVIVGYAHPPPPTGSLWIAQGKKPGESVIIHAERG